MGDTVSQNGTVVRPSRHSHKYASTQYVIGIQNGPLRNGRLKPVESVLICHDFQRTVEQVFLFVSFFFSIHKIFWGHSRCYC